MKKNKGIIIASVVAVALVGSIALGLSFKNNTVNAGANKEKQIEVLTDEMKDKFDEVNSLILLGDEKVENKDYTGALTYYDNALAVLEDFAQEKELPVAQLGELVLPLKRDIISKIENVKEIIEKEEKLSTSEDQNQVSESVSTITETTEKQTEITTKVATTIKEQSTQATTNIKETTTQSTTQKPVETTTVKKEPVTETTTNKPISNNNSSSNDDFNKLFEDAFGIHPDELEGGQVGGGEVADFSPFSSDGTMGKYLGE